MESPLSSWEWKTEPVSPPQIYEDTWLFDDGSTADDLTAFKLQSTIVKDELSQIVPSENKAEVVSRLLEDLDHLDQLEDFIKEEPFSNWLEEKTELPVFEDIRIEPARGYTVVPPQRFKTEELKPVPQLLLIPQHHQNVQPAPPQAQPVPIGPQDTNSLLQEFESVFDEVEMNHGQLTPPQSPPLTNVHVLNTLNPVPISFAAPQTIYYQQVLPERLPAPLPATLPVELLPGTPQPDVAHELAVVEELVRSRAENMVDSWEGSSESKQIMSPSSPSSSSSSGFSEYSSDPEWIPEPVQSSSSASLVDRPARGRKRAGKPYSRVGPEDKKSRKKEQNKNAATKYRLKKKAEIECIISEEKALQQNQSDLAAQVTDLQREIKCLKGLMRDLFKAKGLLQ